MSQQTLVRIVELVGPTLRPEGPVRGWPCLATIQLPSQEVRLALHAAPIGGSSRKRDSVERRLQNSNKNRPVSAPPGTRALLLGLWEDGTKRVLVAFDAERRIGKTTRFSLFVPSWLLEQAALSGWAEHLSASVEAIFAFHPALLPTYVEMLTQGAHVNADSIAHVLDASGLVDGAALGPEERARRATLALVRSAVFGKRVIDAYRARCAVCDLNLGLCQGAHIYPVSAPGSHDEVWNGLALCSNHHAAFDRHLLWVEPESRIVRVHPRVHEHARTSESSKLFVASALARLREPMALAERPRAETFIRRYAFYEGQYGWAS